jgi:hypothetical protein
MTRKVTATTQLTMASWSTWRDSSWISWASAVVQPDWMTPKWPASARTPGTSAT